MLHFFRKFFGNEFQCGWISGIIAISLAVVELHCLSQWWK